MTNFLKYEERLNYIIYLAEREQTGTLTSLADKLGVSKRTVKRMVEALRSKGINITYSRSRLSYTITY